MWKATSAKAGKEKRISIVSFVMVLSEDGGWEEWFYCGKWDMAADAEV
jgi:hypothetical protein